MSTIKLHDLHFKPFISENELSKIVSSLVKEVRVDLTTNEVPLFIGILNGSFLFAADFIRKYPNNCEVSFVKLSSYQGTESSEIVNELIGINEDLTGRTVIILEDIIDTGATLHKIYDTFKNKNVKQLKIATLFFKPDVYRKELPIHYIGKSIEDKFIVGYGLDYNGLGRNLPAVYQLTKEPK
jgi:adenylate kinase